MIAFELATEITFKEMVKQGLAKRREDDNYIQEMGEVIAHTFLQE